MVSSTVYNDKFSYKVIRFVRGGCTSYLCELVPQLLQVSHEVCNACTRLPCSWLLSIHLLAIKPHVNILYNAYHRGVQYSGTLRTGYQDQWLLLIGMDQTVLYQYTARTILTCSSTCPALSVVYWPSVECHMKKLLTKMECGVYRINLQRKELLNVSWMFTKYLSNHRVRQILVASGSTTFNKVTIVTDVVMVTGVIRW